MKDSVAQAQAMLTISHKRYYLTDCLVSGDHIVV